MKSEEQLAQRTSQSTVFYDGERVAGTPFRVVARIGQGGMGSVYEVEHVELGKRFVLKALLDQFSQRQDLVQRLRNEWKSLGRLEHPNIVSVAHAGVAANGVPYYVMERLIGETLGGAIQRLGRLSLLDALRIAAEVLEGLQAAHEIGIVHRDVKPPNIFLTRHGTVKLLDFGIAKLTDGAVNLDLTGRGIAIGTPRYMSPEQAAGERVDGRADLYAVGLVLFEMLSGCGPFDGCESHEVFLAHLTRQPPRLTSLVAGIPPEVEAFIGALLAKRVVDRPKSAGAAATALRSMLRTYGGLDAEPDTQAQELSGVLTPLLRNSYLPPSVPPPARYLEQSPYPEQAPFAEQAAHLEQAPHRESGYPELPYADPSPYSESPYSESPLAEPPLARRGGAPDAVGALTSARGLDKNWALAGQKMSPLAARFGAAPGAPNQRSEYSVAPTSAPLYSTTPGGPETLGVHHEPTPGAISNSAPPGSVYPRSLFGKDWRVKHLAALSFVVVGAAGVAGWIARAPAQGSRSVAPGMAPLTAAAGYVAEPEFRPNLTNPSSLSSSRPHIAASGPSSGMVKADDPSARSVAVPVQGSGQASPPAVGAPGAQSRSVVDSQTRREARQLSPGRSAPVRPERSEQQTGPAERHSGAPTQLRRLPGSGLPGSGLPGAD